MNGPFGDQEFLASNGVTVIRNGASLSVGVDRERVFDDACVGGYHAKHYGWDGLKALAEYFAREARSTADPTSESDALIENARSLLDLLTEHDETVALNVADVRELKTAFDVLAGRRSANGERA